MSKLGNTIYKTDAKLNKSGRFSPSIVSEVEARSKKYGITFSKMLEELVEIGLRVTEPEVYEKINKLALLNRVSYGDFVLKILKEYIDKKN